MIKLEIHPHFRGLIRPLGDEEYNQLEANILAEGCRDTIKHWRGFIVDGHNRYEICRKHDLPYKVQKLGFSTHKDALIWIINNQLGRRNLTEATKARLALEKMDLLKEKASGNRTKIGCTPVHRHKAAAEDAGISITKLYKYMRIYEIGEPKLLRQLENGEIKVSKAYNDLRSCRASDYKLVVSEKTVDEWYVNDSRLDITNSHCASLFLGNIERLNRRYQFITNKAAYLSPGDELERIQRRLMRQEEVAWGMLES